MPLSHVCPECGTDLARIRTEPDPRYALRLVRCPQCSRVSVRARDPIRALWRAARVRAGAAALLIGHVAVLVSLSTGFAAVAVEPLTRALRRNNTREQFEVAAALVILVGLASFWMGLTVTHRSLLTRAAIWLGLQAVGIVSVAAYVRLAFGGFEGAFATAGPNPLVVWLTAAGLSGFVVVLIEPLAMLGRAAWRVGASGTFRWRRRRAKLLRSGV